MLNISKSKLITVLLLIALAVFGSKGLIYQTPKLQCDERWGNGARYVFIVGCAVNSIPDEYFQEHRS